jgi:hypothetical protein
MPLTKSESVKKNAMMVVDKFMEDGGVFEDDEFWRSCGVLRERR